MVGMHFSPRFLPLAFLRKYCAVARAPGTTSRRDTLTVPAIKLLSTRTMPYSAYQNVGTFYCHKFIYARA